jgi:hypothetical protein
VVRPDPPSNRTVESEAAWRSILRLDRWMDGMRLAGGYGGPVVHWWRDCLVFCGPGLDWRYEGIIAGYVTLFERTGEHSWLAKARRAADDVSSGQLSDGRYRHSRFEANPGPGGTPHEAAVDIGLLSLARTLRATGDPAWLRYLTIAERNVTEFHLGSLWDSGARRYHDGPRSFVPNKAATFVEMLCLLSELTDLDRYREHIVATADDVLSHQVRDRRSPFRGGIAQATIDGHRVRKFFPYYVARCIPGLLAASVTIGDDRYFEAARDATGFVTRWREGDGALPQLIYARGAVNRYPQWIAGAGDVARALSLARDHGIDADPRPTLRWMMAGQLESGGISTAHGFGSQVTQRRPTDPGDARDLLPVAGWNDKAFRALAMVVPVSDEAHVNNDARTSDKAAASRSRGREVEVPCRWRGRPAVYREDEDRMEVVTGSHIWFRWRKTDAWGELPPWSSGVARWH